MKVVTKNCEILNVKEVHVTNDDELPGIIFPDQIQRFIFDETGKDLKDYELARFGRISVAYKTFINNQLSEDDLELSLWDKDFKSRYTIASFERDFEDNDWMGYKLVSCGERLNDEDINYSDFGKAVKFAYKILNEYYCRNNKEE